MHCSTFGNFARSFSFSPVAKTSDSRPSKIARIDDKENINSSLVAHEVQKSNGTFIVYHYPIFLFVCFFFSYPLTPYTDIAVTPRKTGSKRYTTFILTPRSKCDPTNVYR